MIGGSTGPAPRTVFYPNVNAELQLLSTTSLSTVRRLMFGELRTNTQLTGASVN